MNHYWPLNPNNRANTILLREQGPGGRQAELDQRFMGTLKELQDRSRYELAMGTFVFMTHACTQKILKSTFYD